MPILKELPRYEAIRVEDDGKRVYETPQGRFPSVTTVLSKTGNKLEILKWRESIGDKKADEILRVACARGDGTHLNAEHWLKTREEPKLNLMTRRYWRSMRPFLDQVDRPLLIEGAVWHKDGYAGTLDCLATLTEFGDEPILCDWKTADRPKTRDRLYDYSLQCAAYVKAANYVYANLGIKIRQAKIVIAIAEHPCQVETLNENALAQLYIHFKARLKRFTK